MSTLKSFLSLVMLLTWSMVWWPAGAAEAKNASGRCCAKKPKTADAITRCPVYCYMNHGSYCSYYSLVPPQPCQQPASLDTVCKSPLGCPGGGCVTVMIRKKGKATIVAPKHHYTKRELAKDGIDPPDKEDPVQVAGLYDTKILDTKIMEFCKQVTTVGADGTLECRGKKLIAKVFVVKVKPSNPAHPELTFGVGYQLKNYTGKVDLSVDEDEVKTTEKSHGHRVALTEIKRPDGSWQECNILFLKDESPDDETGRVRGNAGRDTRSPSASRMRGLLIRRRRPAAG